jgi:hypothetical protein
MDNCGDVQMNKYWNFVAVPTFIGTILFGLYVLFTTDEVHFASKDQIRDTVREVEQAVTSADPGKP